MMTLPLPRGTVIDGTNIIRFRFNHTDGVASGYRVLAWNFLTDDGTVLLTQDFVEDAPETWTPPLPDTASISAGRDLWRTASLIASCLPDSPRIQAHCSNCHASFLQFMDKAKRLCAVTSPGICGRQQFERT